MTKRVGATESRIGNDVQLRFEQTLSPQWLGVFSTLLKDYVLIKPVDDANDGWFGFDYELPDGPEVAETMRQIRRTVKDVVEDSTLLTIEWQDAEPDVAITPASWPPTAD